MASNSKVYDIILLYTQFRVHNYYLNIVKHLSGDFSIGVYDIDYEYTDKAKKKVRQTDQMFLTLCQNLGAEILEPGKRYVCKLLLAPQHRYSAYEADYIERSKTKALHRFGSGSTGLIQLKDMGVKKIWVYEKKLFLEMLLSEKKSHLKDDFEIEEMGTPYAKYPAFDFKNLTIDYLIAYPTIMLLRQPAKRCRLFENMNRLIDAIPMDMKICLKLHNVRDGGYMLGSSQLLKKLGHNLNALLNTTTAGLFSCLPNWGKEVSWWNSLYSLREKIICSTIEEKVTFLSDITYYYNLGLEHFLPYVKKGVITGISSCIWHSLYQRLPVFNCDDQPLQENMPNYAVYKNFYIPPCHGKLDFNATYFDKVSASTRRADLIKLIRNEL